MPPKDNPGVKTTYGVHEMIADAVGKTIADLRAGLQQAMNIPANAGAVIAGKRVGDGHILLAGQEVEFVKEAGVKGDE